MINNIVAFTESAQEPRRNLGLPRDISSPITSDEEYLSPLEEGMDFGGPELRKTIDTRFRKPPAFLVRLHRAQSDSILQLTLPFSLLLLYFLHLYLLNCILMVWCNISRDEI